MDPSTLSGLNSLIPIQYQVYGLMSISVISVVGKLLGSWRTRGGLRNILLGAWYGDSVPPPVARDYAQELTKPKSNE